MGNKCAVGVLLLLVFCVPLVLSLGACDDTPEELIDEQTERVNKSGLSLERKVLVNSILQIGKDDASKEERKETIKNVKNELNAAKHKVEKLNKELPPESRVDVEGALSLDEVREACSAGARLGDGGKRCKEKSDARKKMLESKLKEVGKKIKAVSKEIDASNDRIREYEEALKNAPDAKKEVLESKYKEVDKKLKEIDKKFKEIDKKIDVLDDRIKKYNALDSISKERNKTLPPESQVDVEEALSLDEVREACSAGAKLSDGGKRCKEKSDARKKMLESKLKAVRKEMKEVGKKIKAVSKEIDASNDRIREYEEALKNAPDAKK